MMQDAVHAYRRRAILSLLEYDSDYRLSLEMLDLCLEQTGQNATYDQLQTDVAWLEEQRRDLYKLDGYTIEMTYPDGTTARQLFFF